MVSRQLERKERRDAAKAEAHAGATPDIAPRAPDVGYVAKLILSEDPQTYFEALAERYISIFCDRRTPAASYSWNTKKQDFAWWCDHSLELTPRAVAAMFRGQRDLIGGYFLHKPGGLTRCPCADIDGHKPSDDPQGELAKLLRGLAALELPFVADLSKGGRGYHIRLPLADGISKAQNDRLFAAIFAHAGVKPDTEVFPKTETFSQVALPGSITWRARTGGSCLLDPATLEPMPIERQLEYLERVEAERITGAQLKRACAAMGLASLEAPLEQQEARQQPDAATHPARARGSARGDFDPDTSPRWTLDLLERFLVGRGVSFKKGAKPWNGSGRVPWTHIIELKACVNAGAHSSGNPDGAAVLYCESDGRVGYQCFHAGCSGFGWARARAALDPADTYRLPKPPRRPRVVDHRDGAPQDHPEPEQQRRRRRDVASFSSGARSILKTIADEHFKRGSTQRTRLRNLSNCGAASAEKFCREPGHGTDHRRHVVCQLASLCPYCAGRRAHAYSDYIRRNWPEQVAVARFNASTLDELRSIRVRMTSRFARGAAYLWILGLSQGAFFAYANRSATLRRAAEEASTSVLVETITREQAAALVEKLWTDPSRAFQSLVTDGDYHAVADFPFVIDDVGVRRVDGSRVDETPFPWPTEAELRETLVEEARADRGDADQDHCSCEVVERDGSRRRCGATLDWRVVDAIDGELLFEEPGATPYWKIVKRAFANLNAKWGEKKDRARLHAPHRHPHPMVT